MDGTLVGSQRSTPTMKYFYGFCRLFSLAGILLNCKPVQPDLLLDGTPRIKSIAFASVPPQNVAIDQQRKAITIKLPPLLNPSIANPAIDLTPGAALVSRLPLTGLFVGQDKQIVITDGNSSAQWQSYSVNFVPSGSLTPEASTIPLEYTLGDGHVSGVAVPMRNLYANPLPKRARFIHQSTGEVVIDSAFAKGWTFDSTSWADGRINELTIRINSSVNQSLLPLLPGRHSVELTTAEGQALKLFQPVIIKKGAIQTKLLYEESPANNSMSYDNRPISPGDWFGIEGQNLFEGDITLKLIDSLDHELILSEVQYNRYGQKLWIRVPPTARLGHYVLRVTQRVPPSSENCLPFRIRSKPAVPFEIIDLNGGFTAYCSYKGPTPIPVIRFSALQLTALTRRCGYD